MTEFKPQNLTLEEMKAKMVQKAREEAPKEPVYLGKSSQPLENNPSLHDVLFSSTPRPTPEETRIRELELQLQMVMKEQASKEANRQSGTLTVDSTMRTVSPTHVCIRDTDDNEIIVNKSFIVTVTPDFDEYEVIIADHDDITIDTKEYKKLMRSLC